MPRIVRTITYEGSEEQLLQQLANSLADGTYPDWLTRITVETTVSDVPGVRGGRVEGWKPRLDAPPPEAER